MVSTSGEFANPYQFVGGYGCSTEETGLVYMRARYYAPSIGRFISRDPLWGNVYHPQSLNRYVYTQNNPVNVVDPSGEIALVIVVKIIAELTGVAYISWQGFQQLCKGMKLLIDKEEKEAECLGEKPRPLEPWQQKIWQACQWVDQHIWPIVQTP